MAVLERQSPTLLILGGAVMTALLVVMVAAPTSPAIYGFFLVAPALGLGVLGAVMDADGSAGRAVQVAAWAAMLGGVSLAAVGVYAVATNQFVTGSGSDDPMLVPFAITSIAWMVGSVCVAVALVRSGAISSLGAGLVLAGTVTALVLGTILGSIAPDISPLSAAPFGLGWAVVGWRTRRVSPGARPSRAPSRS